MKNLKCEECVFWNEDANEHPCAGCFENVNFVPAKDEDDEEGE